MNPVFQKVLNGISKHSPEILTGVGLAGMISGTVLAVKATPKAIKQIEQRCEEEHVDELSFGEKFRTAWKCYIPAAVTTVLSSGCIISGLSINLKRNAGLAVAASLAETTLRECQKKMIDMIGEEKTHEIVHDAQVETAKKDIQEHPYSEARVQVTGLGNTLCRDEWGGGYFLCDANAIKQAVNEFNNDLITDPFDSFKYLNDFYDLLHLKQTGSGAVMGCGKGHLLQVYYESDLTDTNEPVLVIIIDKNSLTTYDDHKMFY